MTPLLLAALLVLMPACKEKETEKAAEAPAKPRRERPERMDSSGGTATREPKRTKMEGLGIGRLAMEQGRFFSRAELAGLEVDALLAKVAALPKKDRRSAAWEMVILFPEGEWERMLEYTSRLPIGGDSAPAINSVYTKLAMLNPQVWTEQQALLKEKLTESQYSAAAREFGRFVAARGDVLAEFDGAMAAPGVSAAARGKFVEGLFDTLEPEDAGLAKVLLPKLAGPEQVAAVERNPELFKDSIVPGDAALEMLGKLAPAERDGMAKAMGGVFSQAGPETARPEVAAMAAKLPPAQETQLYLSYYEGLARQDLNRTLELVPAIPKPEVRDRVVSRMISQIRWHDKEMAVKWAETISDPKERERRLESLK